MRPITLKEFLSVVDVPGITLHVPLTPYLAANIRVDTHDQAQMADLMAMYGESALFSAEISMQGSELVAELTGPMRPGLPPEGAAPDADKRERTFA